MGCDGGVRFVKTKAIVKNWKRIKEDLINYMRFYEVSDGEMNDAINDLPDDITGYDADKIVEMLQFLSYCDCPYNFKGKYIAFSEGDNTPDYANALSSAMSNVKSSTYIETWT